MSQKNSVADANLQEFKQGLLYFKDLERHFGQGNVIDEAYKIYGCIFLYVSVGLFVLIKSNPSTKSEIVGAINDPIGKFLQKQSVPEWLQIFLVPIMAICVILKNQDPIHFRESRIAIILVCLSDLFLRVVRWQFGDFDSYSLPLHAFLLLDFFAIGGVSTYAKSDLLLKTDYSYRLIVSPPSLIGRFKWFPCLPRSLPVPNRDESVSNEFPLVYLTDLIFRFFYMYGMSAIGIQLGCLFVKLCFKRQRNDDSEDRKTK